MQSKVDCGNSQPPLTAANRHQQARKRSKTMSLENDGVAKA